MVVRERIRGQHAGRVAGVDAGLFDVDATNEEFIEDWAVAQVMPGPNVINLSLVLGARYFGWRGALMALLGLVALPLVIVIAVAYTYSQFSDSTAVQGALRGMGAVAAGLMGYHYTLIRDRDRPRCFKAFLHNNWVGAAIFAGWVADYLLR